MALHLRALVTLLEDSDSIPSTNIAAYKQTPRDPMPYTGLYGHLAPTWHIKHVCRQNFHIHKSYTIFYDVIWHVGNKQEREGYGLTVMCLSINLKKDELCWLHSIVNSTQPRVNWKGIRRHLTGVNHLLLNYYWILVDSGGATVVIFLY